MTDLNIPNIFVPGTKAKAQEVNENFTAVKNAINARALEAGDETQTFKVATATQSSHAVNKQQFDTLSNDLSTIANAAGTNFCAKSGKVNSSNEPEALSYSGNTVTLNASETNLVIANASGITTTITENKTVSIPAEDGGYNIYASVSDGAISAYKNNILISNQEPDISFTQPVIYTNGIVGRNYFAVQASGENEGYGHKAYYISGPETNMWSANGLNQWITFYNPKPLKISNLKIINAISDANRFITAGIIYGSNDNITWSQSLGTFSMSAPYYNTFANIDLSEAPAYKYWKIFSTNHSGNGTGILKIEITGTEIFQNDIWLDTSKLPYKAFKYDGTDWSEEFTGVPIGSATVSNGVITQVKTFPYNTNGININANSTGLTTNWQKAIPEYGKGEGKSWNTTYTATKSGWLFVRAYLSDNKGYAVTIDGITVISEYIVDVNNTVQTCCFIEKGSTYSVTGSGSNSSTVFYPCKGEL